MIVSAAAGDYNQTVLSGALLAAVPIAVLGGLVSFFSPCVLPLVPAYLGQLTAVAIASREGGSPSRASARNARSFADVVASASSRPPSATTGIVSA